MNLNSRTLACSVAAGLLLSVASSLASVEIDPIDIPNESSYYPPSGTPSMCPSIEMTRACATVIVTGRSMRLCCQKRTYKCIGNSTTWTTATVFHASRCGSNFTCVDQATGEPVVEPILN